jgi:DNA polymerase-3 subunit beta
MDLCKALPEGTVLTFREEQDRVTIRAGRSRFTLSTLPASEFPNLEESIGKFKFSIPERHLKSLIEQIAFAMAEQDVRYYLNGMLLEVKNRHIYGVAADGHRLAFGKIALLSSENSSARVIIPRKGILELQRVLGDSVEAVEVTLGDNHIRAITSQVQLTSKLLDGRFPDYERIVLQEGDKVLTGSREVLKEAFQRAAALFSDRFRGVRLRLTEGCLKILATNAEQDEVEEDIEIDYVGGEFEIGFNVKYLIDFLNIIQSERIKFIFSDPNSSARIEGVGTENGVYIIMPMRI